MNCFSLLINRFCELFKGAREIRQSYLVWFNFLMPKYFYQLDKIIIMITLLEKVTDVSTTIPIDKPTKARLFLLKNRIEQQEGRPINYSELLQILIKNMEFLQAPKHLNDFRKFQGILPSNAMESFRKERELDLKAEERMRKTGRKRQE